MVTTSDLSLNKITARSASWEQTDSLHKLQPTSIKHFLLTVILYVCETIMFVNPYFLVIVYWTSLALLSLTAEVYSMPKTYFASSDNIFNEFFVKYGWGWTMVVVFPFSLLTSYVYCCSKWKLVLKHLARLLLATSLWYVCTTVFQEIESHFGVCILGENKYKTKRGCVENGYNWSSFDISSHAFLLTYSCMILIEESQVLFGWGEIEDLINEENQRRIIKNEEEEEKNESLYPLEKLTAQELSNLEMSYWKLTPCIQCLFIAMTCLTLLWDVMLLSTILYFHTVIEKIIGGVTAIALWFVTYKYWFTLAGTVPLIPGVGLFEYGYQ